MQFVADENVPRPVLNRLRASGYDVVSIQESLCGISDRDVLKVAESQNRVLITADRDFGELSVRHRVGATSVIVSRMQPGRIASPRWLQRT